MSTTKDEEIPIPMATLLDANHTAATTTTPLPPFYGQQHVRYIAKLATDLSAPTSFEGAVTEHLRMSGIYWSLTALHIVLPSAEKVDNLMHVLSAPDRCSSSGTGDDATTASSPNNNDHDQSIVDWLWTCYNTTTGSFGGNTGHEGHLLYTLSALQILALSNQLQSECLLAHKQSIVHFIEGLQQPDGSFAGDASGEIDTRFTYCALQSLALLGELVSVKDSDGKTAVQSSSVNLDKAVAYIWSCKNLDGGFGSCTGAESHAGQVFCCVGALSIAGRLVPATDDKVDHNTVDDTYDLLGWWLSERQVDSGGLNGRPEKQADVCYSWWILSALAILGKTNWINVDKLAMYILKCQDDEDGGIADRPEDMADVFHTFFGIAGLSLTGHLHTPLQQQHEHSKHYRRIDPVYALPTDIVQSLNLPGQVLVRRANGVDERLLQYDKLYSEI